MKNILSVVVMLVGLSAALAQEPVPPPATAAEISAGTDNYKRITPYGLAQAGGGGGSGLVSATGNALTTNDTRSAFLAYTSVGYPINTNAIVFSDYLDGGTNATLYRKAHLVYTNATSGLIYWAGGLSADGDLVITNAAHPDPDSDYAGYAFSTGTFPSPIPTSWEDLGVPLGSMTGSWILTSNTVAATDLYADRWSNGRLAVFGTNAPTLVDGQGINPSGNGIKIVTKNNSDADKILLSLINPFPKLTEIYIENQSPSGTRLSDLVMGVNWTGQAFIGSPGLFRIIDPETAEPHDDLVAVNRTNKTTYIMETLSVSNRVSSTNIAIISKAGSVINGVGFTNRGINLINVNVHSGEATIASTTFSDSVAVEANLTTPNKYYTIEWTVFVDNSTAADGVKIDMQNGTASVSGVRAHIEAFDSSGQIMNARVTALSTATTAATLTGNGVIVVKAGLNITTAGTVKLRVAKNSHTTGTVTIRAHSHVVSNLLP